MNYFLTQQIPTHFSNQQKQQFRNRIKNYTVENDLLYKIDRNDVTKLYRVIQKSELPALLYMMHNDPISGHFATDTMFNKIKK